MKTGYPTRTSSVVAFKLTANAQLDSLRKRFNWGTSPLVEMVTFRGLKWRPCSSTNMSEAFITFSIFWSGSPIPYQEANFTQEHQRRNRDKYKTSIQTVTKNSSLWKSTSYNHTIYEHPNLEGYHEYNICYSANFMWKQAPRKNSLLHYLSSR